MLKFDYNKKEITLDKGKKKNAKNVGTIAYI